MNGKWVIRERFDMPRPPNSQIVKKVKKLSEIAERKRNIHLHTAVPCCRQTAAECLEVDDERTLWAGCETATQWIQAPERPEAEQSVRDLGYRESPPVTRSTL